MVPVIDNLFYLILFLITNQFWQWPMVIDSVLCCCFVR